MTKLLIVAAVLFVFLAIAVWFAFLREVPVDETVATIRSKTYKPAGTYWQQQVGSARGFRSATPINTTEQYVLELYSAELDTTGFFPVSTWDEAMYNEGISVTMAYQKRGLPAIGYRIVVLNIRPLVK